MLRFFRTDMRRNIIKVVCLTLGLSLGFILVAKIFVETTYDAFYPDSDRIYRVAETMEINGEYIEYGNTAGGIAPGLKQYVPSVEAATRSTFLAPSMALRLPDGREVETDGVTLADSCFFDVLQRQIVAGDPHAALATADGCMIPRSLADKIGGGADVIGTVLTAPSFSGSMTATVEGVYEDFPINSTVPNHVYVGLAAIGKFSHDGRDNWMGNDRYHSYGRLAPGTVLADLKPIIARMLADNVGPDAEKYQYSFSFWPITSLHNRSLTNKTMIWVLALLAVVMLMSSSLNYLLVVIGQMGKRNKEMAIRKCFGTGRGAIFRKVIGESVFFLAVSVVLAVLLVVCFSDECLYLLGNSAAQLLTTPGVWAVELGVCALLLIVTGVVPAWMYCRTPVINAFRTNPKHRRVWKLALLAVQFFASGLLVCLLVLVVRQYSLMSSGDLGFDPSGVAMVNVQPLERGARSNLMTQLSELPGVESVASGYHDFMSAGAGNNVWTDDPDRAVNVADLYDVNPELVATLGMRLVQGEGFSAHADSTINEVLVDEEFVNIFRDHFGVADGNIVGQRFFITEHWDHERRMSIEYTIAGVVSKLRLGGFTRSNAEARAAVMFPSSAPSRLIYIRFDHLGPDALLAAQAVIDRVAPDAGLSVVSLPAMVEAGNSGVLRFGTSVMIAGVVILLIALIGLVGYTSDEVQRRSREIAIRKVNGTPASAILRLFCVDIFKVALPSLLLGGAAAMVIGSYWLEQFVIRVGLSPLPMIAGLMLIIILLAGVVVANAMHIARSNPVEYLRQE